MTTNEHRWAARVNPITGRKMTDGFCTAQGCGWKGTRVQFYRYHLYDIVPKIGDDRSWRFHRRQKGLPA